MATTIVNLPAGYTLDDFDETKNFHRVLFRPGYSVQARELTQLQTSLQAQIDRHGQYSFKDGSRVVNGKVTLNVEYDFVKVCINDNPDCCKEIEWLPPSCIGQGSNCEITSLDLVAGECNDDGSTYNLLLDFDFENTNQQDFLKFILEMMYSMIILNYLLFQLQ